MRLSIKWLTALKDLWTDKVIEVVNKIYVYSQIWENLKSSQTKNRCEWIQIKKKQSDESCNKANNEDFNYQNSQQNYVRNLEGQYCFFQDAGTRNAIFLDSN